MCRWITLISCEPVSLSDIILAPSNSLVQLAKDASYHPEFSEMNNHVTNGDGFGVGWYHCNDCVDNTNTGIDARPVNGCANHRYAAIFKDTQPAWNNINLRELCRAVKSDCMIAHVRAASVFAGISQQNCHPFKAGRILFCHNGRIGNFDMVRRNFHSQLTDEAYLQVKGTTDSETLFHLICTFLSNDGMSELSAYQQTEPFGHERLTNAVKKVLKAIAHTLQKFGANESNFSTLNFSITDGETVVVTRYCDKSPAVPPPSLYFAFGDAEKLHEELVESENTSTVPLTPHGGIKTMKSTVSSGGDSVPEGDVEAEADGDEDEASSEFDENIVSTTAFESKPGTVYADIDHSSASFIVASNPLTKTHTWHPMPKNSIMWYKRGSLPELRLLKTRNRRSMSIVMSKEMRESRFFQDVQGL